MYECHDFLLSREVSLSSMEKVGKRKREQRFMPGIIASQWQSVLELNYLWLYFRLDPKFTEII